MRTLFKRVVCFIVAFAICATFMPQIVNVLADGEEPPLSSKCEMIIEQSGKDNATFGSNAINLRENTLIKFSSIKNLTAVDKIELNVFVENKKALKDYITEEIRFALYFSSNRNYEDLNCSYADITNQIVNDGWNTVTIEKNSFNGTVNWASVRFIYLGFTKESGALPTALAGKVVKYKNVCDVLSSPEINDGDVVIYNDVTLNTLGESTSSLVADTGDRFSAAFNEVDISNVDTIKVDFYIPDYAEYTTFANQNALKISLLSANGAISVSPIKNYTTREESGWYTTEFAVSKMEKSGNFNAAAVTGIKAQFVGESGAVVGAAYSLKFAFANVRGFKVETSEITQNYGNLVSQFCDDKIGGVISTDYYSLDSAVKGDYEKIKDAEYIEFDLYVSNAQGFRNAFLYDGDNNQINASWKLVLGSGSKTLAFDNVEKQVVTNGWNHIVLAVSGAQNNGFAMDEKFTDIIFAVSGVNKEIKATAGGVFVATNFVATKGLAADKSLKFDKLAVISNGKADTLGDTFAGSTISQTVATVDTKDAAFIELDIYVQNFTAVKALMAEKNVTGIKLCLASADGSAELEILGRIKQNGWNHIAVSYSKFDITGSFDAAVVTSWSIVFAGATTENTGLLNGQTVSVANITACVVENPKLPKDAVVISEEGKSGVYGSTYDAVANNSLIALGTPIDITSASNIEFDFYVEDYESFKNMLSNSGDPLYFVLGTNENKAKNMALYQFAEQVTDDGWNHIELKVSQYSNGAGAPDLSTVRYAYISFLNDTSANAYSAQKFNIKNICVTIAPIDMVPEKPKYEIDILENAFYKTWGDYYNYTGDRLTTSIAPIDISKMAQVEFDIYIDDYDAFKSAIQGKALRFVLASGGNRHQNRAAYDVEHLIKQQGWNHIVIDLAAYYLKDSTDFSSIKWVGFSFWNGSGVTNPIGSTVVRVANIGANFAEYDYLPALPDEVLAQLGVAKGDDENGEGRWGHTVGEKFHYTMDRIYRQKLTPVDFSKSNIIEFDVYISDYEKFLAAENDPTDGKDSKLNFLLSSTAPSLLPEYTDKNGRCTSRVYYSSGIDLAPYITHSGWNHVKVGKSEFVTKNHGVDWSGLTAFMVYYRNSTNLETYNNANKDLYVKVANIVNTGLICTVPYDNDQPAKPDKNAVYISSVDGLSDENGAWNIANPIISTNYKTAGKSSLSKKVNYASELSDTIMSYILDSTADMSDLKTLKFDLFVDLAVYLNPNVNKMEIIIGNNRFGRDDYYGWNIDLSKIKDGWNQYALDIKDATVVGNADLSKAKLVMIRFTELGFSSEKYEEIICGIDNIRYISSTGNTILKVEGWDSKPQDTLTQDDSTTENDDSIQNDDLTQDSLTDDSVEKETITKVVNKTGKTKINRVVEKTTVPDYLTYGIVVGIEVVVVAAAFVIFVIIYRKKTKKQ